ncbi:MAG: hypothetical protein EXR98_01070 [Gemmataceae bacterium]|nr:hypothetical protein [Gemmataceae bacterium]
MKALRFLLVGTTVLFASAVPALAQRVEVQPIQIRPGLQADVPLLTAEAVEKLKFTNEQKDKYAKVETDYKEKNKAVQDKFRADIQGVRDREKYKDAIEKQQTYSKKAREDSLAKVEPILTADQKTVFAQVKQDQPQPRPGIGGVRPVQIGGGIGQVLPAGVQQRLQLTDEQKKQIEAIQKEVEAKVLKVLTDDQKKQLEQMKKGIIIRPRPVDPAQPNLLPRRPVNPQPAVEPKKN